MTETLSQTSVALSESGLAQDMDDAAPALTRASALAALDRIGEDAGYFQTLGPRHWAFFVDEAPTILVSFEQIDDIRTRPGQMPLGHDIARQFGWSHLCLIADGDTFYRDDRVYGYFDRLVDDAFFEDFDHVLFFGAGVQGYAAAAFSVAAPGSTVVALAPRATLAPSVAGWDKRLMPARRLDFTTRYGYAPDMTDGARQLVVIHDPDCVEDAMHATLFQGPYVMQLRAPHLGGRLDLAFDQMGIAAALVQAAIEGTLTPQRFAALWRARRDFGPYLRALLSQARAKGRVPLEKRICQNVAQRLNAPLFRERLADILAAEAEAELENDPTLR